jgi:hypothetical protein
VPVISSSAQSTASSSPLSASTRPRPSANFPLRSTSRERPMQVCRYRTPQAAAPMPRSAFLLAGPCRHAFAPCRAQCIARLCWLSHRRQSGLRCIPRREMRGWGLPVPCGLPAVLVHVVNVFIKTAPMTQTSASMFIRVIGVQ